MNNPDELQELVRMAKEFEKSGKLKESKHKFLDAASLSLTLSKEKDYVKRLSYENIAKELIIYAKEIQMEITMRKESLPLPPGKLRQSVEKTPTITTKLDIEQSYPDLFQFLIITEGGIPIFKHEFQQISQKTTTNLNEILFSGAITAINQIIMEILDRNIKAISFEDGVLIMHPFDNKFFVMYAKESNDFLLLQLDKFCEQFITHFANEIKESLRTGQVLNEYQTVNNYVDTYFR